MVGRFHSGWPRTPLLVDPIIDANDNIVGVIPDLSQRNSADFDDYSRVDFRVSRLVPLQRGSFEYYFEIFNIFDTQNQCWHVESHAHDRPGAERRTGVR